MRSYFDIFEFPAYYDVDLSVLRQRYLRLQQLHHPDMGNNEQTQLLSQEINMAYGVLKDDIKRAEYLLKLLGSHIEPQAADPEFLEEMWQLLSHIQSCRDVQELTKLLQQYSQFKERAILQIRQAFANTNMQVIADKIAEVRYYITIIKALEDGIEHATAN